MKTPRILPIVLALLCAAFLITPAISTARAAERPNIVVIISDDQAWGDYSFMGHPVLKTPNLDRLAAESLTFRRGYVPASLCCPSLASIVTGRYPHHIRHEKVRTQPQVVAGRLHPQRVEGVDHAGGGKGGDSGVIEHWYLPPL